MLTVSKRKKTPLSALKELLLYCVARPKTSWTKTGEGKRSATYN